ncbi:histidine phosphatase family protein [Fundicoccus sp. Sow4_D5]|uniref:histidine phosphatase family protein n=1 Tax=unclassified Fundicoccus TaxID=2761543 RepID=UPI003F93D7F9
MSKGVTFYFMRHGETYLNLYGRMQGWANAPLTDRGITDVHRSGKGLTNVTFDAVYSSDLMRTIETAQIILKENQQADHLKIVPMKEFREVHFGFFEGLDARQVWDDVQNNVRLKHGLPAGNDLQVEAALNAVKELDPYKHAENYAEFWNRVENGLLQLLNKHAGTDQNILVVCHGMTIRNLLHGLVADFSENDPLNNASVSIVKYSDGHFQILAYNQTHHFADIAEEADDQ